MAVCTLDETYRFLRLLQSPAELPGFVLHSLVDLGEAFELPDLSGEALDVLQPLGLWNSFTTEVLPEHQPLIDDNLIRTQ